MAWGFAYTPFSRSTEYFVLLCVEALYVAADDSLERSTSYVESQNANAIIRIWSQT